MASEDLGKRYASFLPRRVLENIVGVKRITDPNQNSTQHKPTKHINPLLLPAFRNLQIRMAATNLLRLKKRTQNYATLANTTGFPFQDLSKYTLGYILPSLERSKVILNQLNFSEALKTELQRQCTFDTHGFLDNTALVSDRTILDLLGYVAFQEYGNIGITKVLTAAVDGVPLAATASQVLNANLVIAKKGDEVGIEETLQTRVTVGKTGLMFSLVIGRSQLQSGDHVLIVDDIIRDGATQRALIRLVQKAHAQVSGIFIPIAIGNEWQISDLKPEVEFAPFLQISLD